MPLTIFTKPKTYLYILIALLLAISFGLLPSAFALAGPADPPVYEFQWGTLGSDNGQFVQPIGVAVDGLGNVYVADTSSDRIQKFSSTGQFITKWGSTGSGNSQFLYPR